MVYDEVVAVCARTTRCGRLYTSWRTVSIDALSVCVENSVFAGAIFPQKPPGHTIVPRYVVLRSISVRMIAVLGVTMQTPTRVFVFVGSVPPRRQGFWVLLRSVGQYWSCCQSRRCSIIRVHFRNKLANGPTNGQVTRSILHAYFTPSGSNCFFTYLD